MVGDGESSNFLDQLHSGGAVITVSDGSSLLLRVRVEYESNGVEYESSTSRVLRIHS